MLRQSLVPDRPTDCGLIVGLPTSHEAFLDDAMNVEKSFVRAWAASRRGSSVEALWREYQAIMDYAATIGAEAAESGVAVVLGGAQASWPALVTRRRVVTLIAHWVQRDGRSSVEFTDGLATIGRLIAQIPAGFSGVLDLTTCPSAHAIAVLKHARPACTVLTNRDAAPLDVRLAMYRQIVRILGSEQTTYVEAAARVHHAALEVV